MSGPATASGPPSAAAPAPPARIVVGFDGSPPANRAARLALALAPSGAGNVWFVHATQPDHRMAEPLTDEEIVAPNRAVTRAMESLRAYAQPRGLSAFVVDREGAPGPVLIAVASEIGAELVVVGTRGRGDASRVLLGSVSAYVVAHAPVPVVVVP